VGTGIGNGGGVIGPVKPSSTPKKNATIQYNRPVSSSKDLNAINSPDIQVQGKNNYVGTGIENGIVLGNNNTISPDRTNVIIVGDGVSPTESNSILVGDLLITTDGIRWNNPYIIDGGLNTTMNVGKTNLIDLIDGGLNSIRNYGGDQKTRPIIDGTTDLNE
jgi:hypothetical protein